MFRFWSFFLTFKFQLSAKLIKTENCGQLELSKKDLVVIVLDYEKQIDEQKWKNISKFRDVFNTMPCDVQLQCEQTSV